MDDSHTDEERDKLTIYEYPIDNKYAMVRLKLADLL